MDALVDEMTRDLLLDRCLEEQPMSLDERGVSDGAVTIAQPRSTMPLEQLLVGGDLKVDFEQTSKKNVEGVA